MKYEHFWQLDLQTNSNVKVGAMAISDEHSETWWSDGWGTGGDKEIVSVRQLTEAGFSIIVQHLTSRTDAHVAVISVDAQADITAARCTQAALVFVWR